MLVVLLAKFATLTSAACPTASTRSADRMGAGVTADSARGFRTSALRGSVFVSPTARVSSAVLMEALELVGNATT